MLVLPNIALTYRTFDWQQAADLLKALRANLPDGWKFQEPEPVEIVDLSARAGTALESYDVTVYGPRISVVDAIVLQKLGNCIRYMEFSDDRPS